MDSLSPKPARWRRFALIALLVVAAGQYAWNASAPRLRFRGYDEWGHRSYIATIVDEHRLPHPNEGWSSFHPPFYHLLGSVVWVATERGGLAAVTTGLKSISSISLLATGLVTFFTLRWLGSRWIVAWIATAIAVFVPCAQMAAVMVGNEALAAGLATLALPFVLRLQADPTRVQMGVAAALFSGLAVATKLTAACVVAACIVPFLRLDFDRRMLRALVASACIGAAVTLPVFARSVVLTGSLMPSISAETGPRRVAEARSVIRPRRLSDYLWVNPACLLAPSVAAKPVTPLSERDRLRPPFNPAMTNVWGMTYAGVWADPFALRIPLQEHYRGVWWGPATTLLGLGPTLLTLLGLALAARDAIRRRGRSADAPAVLMVAVGLIGFSLFTWSSASLVFIKGAYLLPLTLPAAIFFARGIAFLDRRVRTAALAVSLLAALSSALVFTEGLLLP